MIHHWRQRAPDDFIFSVKISRYITHIKRLKVSKESFSKFFSRIKHFKENLGPVLILLPPKWLPDPARLDRFLKKIPKEYRYTIEFRDSRWFNDEVFAVLTKHQVCLCFSEINQIRVPERVTSEFIYIRLHGPVKAYKGNYERSVLPAWADKISKWTAQGMDVYCYFDNDEAAYAVKNAKELCKMIKSQHIKAAA